jgi:hypothetical protein
MPIRPKLKKRPSENQKHTSEQKALEQWQMLVEAIRRRKAC